MHLWVPADERGVGSSGRVRLNQSGSGCERMMPKDSDLGWEWSRKKRPSSLARHRVGAAATPAHPQSQSGERAAQGKEGRNPKPCAAARFPELRASGAMAPSGHQGETLLCGQRGRREDGGRSPPPPGHDLVSRPRNGVQGYPRMERTPGCRFLPPAPQLCCLSERQRTRSRKG